MSTKQEVREVRLGHLHENDYNPRENFDDAPMQDLKESIKRVGLVQPLTVRQTDRGYEVISGVRRLRALRDLYEDDHKVVVHVRDVDDDQAQWMALAENLDRDDLSPVEEARAYAEYVDVQVDGEMVDFAEYIKGGDGREALKTPSDNNSSVVELAEKVNPSAGVIKDRLRLLALPDELLTDIENGELGTRVGRTIAKLRKIPDGERRCEAMLQLGQDARFRGSGVNISELRDEVDKRIDQYEREQEQREQRLQEYRELVSEREAKLWAVVKDDIEWANRALDREVSTEAFTGTDADLAGVESGAPVDDAVDVEVQRVAKGLIDCLQEARSELGSAKIDELDDREDRLRTEKQRLEQNIQTIRGEHLDRCPFCKAGVAIDDLEDRVDEYQAEIENLQEQKQELSEQREAFRERRREVRQALNNYQDAVQSLARHARGGGA